MATLRLVFPIALRFSCYVVCSLTFDAQALRAEPSEWAIAETNCYKADPAAAKATPRQGLIESFYRQLSRAIPHRDALYPSCSRYIRDEIHHHGLYGLIVGFGRWAESHITTGSQPRQSIVVKDEKRFYDPPEFLRAKAEYDDFATMRYHAWSAWPAYHIDCSEYYRVEPVVPYGGGPDSAWRL